MLSLEGRQLGNYDVIRRIRSGGMGAVYEGRQRTAFDRRVAIKVILGPYAEDREMRRSFAREARTIARLHHPHILQLIEFGDEQGVLYLVMPFIEGGTLTNYLRRHLPELHEVATIFLQLLDAVEYAHEEGLIHRDIKASNVLLESRRNGPPYVYLADFGLVRTIQQAELGRTHADTPIPLDQVPGTPHYMAPEQTWGVVTPATDIYALGVLLYQLLTGELPYNDLDDIEVIKMHLHAPVPNPRAADASIPAELAEVVVRAMAKRAGQRFPAISDFRQAFRAAIDGPAAQLQNDHFSAEAEEDFEVYELPPLPPKAPRPSQQLRPAPPPAAIEFRERRPRSAEESAAPDQLRSQISAGGEETLQLSPRRPRITDDHAAPPPAKRRLRTTDERPETPQPLRLRTTGAGDEPTLPGGPRSRFTSDNEDEERRRQAPSLHSGAEGGELQVVDGVQKSHKRGKRSRRAWLVGIVVPMVLVLLLLLARAMDANIFPSGFPFLGSPAVATITLTVRTRALNDTFLLTASPQTTRADLNTRVLSDRSVQGSANESRVVATSGIRTIPGTPASGTLLFVNRGPTPVNVAAGATFTASGTIQVHVQHAVLVPARVGSVDGMVNAPAQAVSAVAGQNDNLAPGALNVSCCGGKVMVSNPAAFSGGSAARVTHLVAQSDLDGVRAQRAAGLQQQAVQRIDSQLAPNEVRAGTPGYNVTISSDHPVGSEATQVSVSLTVSATALVYNTRVASDLARQLLSNEAAHSLGASYQVRGGLKIVPPVVEQQGNDGQLYLSVGASGLWAYQIRPVMEQEWRQVIKGDSLTSAQSYLATLPGISAAQIQLPFGTDRLPMDEMRLVFVVI